MAGMVAAVNASENWPIPGYVEHYSATHDGRIWSHKSCKFLRPTVNPRGYAMVDLYVNGKRRMEYVHRLIAMTFAERRSTDTNCVNHIDFDKLNNSISNLEWATQAENLAWSRAAGRMPTTDRMRDQCRVAQRISVEKRRAAT